MLQNSASLRWIAFSSVVLLGGLQPCAGEAAKAPVPVAVVVHPGVPASDLSLAELRRIFLGQRPVWSSELMITLLMPPRGSPEREVLLRQIYQQRSETQYQRYWINRMFADGAPVAPKTTGSREMSASLVREIPGAIALVPLDRIPPDVKVLRIDGRRPGESGYPLIASGGREK